MSFRDFVLYGYIALIVAGLVVMVIAFATAKQDDTHP